ncbi:MAG: MtaA/CmuA family methyltransferase [Candidatus Hydrothermarchaeales archaeon]
MEKITPRGRVLDLLRGEEVDCIPCFSGMGNITQTGLDELGFRFSEVHIDAEKMASLAASTYKLFGFDSAVVPFDIGLEAEAMGCELNFYEAREGIIYPTVKTKINAEEWKREIDVEKKGRVPIVEAAVKHLKEDIGTEVAIGVFVLGPFTLAGQVTDLNELLKTSFKEPERVSILLDKLAEVIISIAGVMKNAGADFLTIREMGASSDVISPRMFESLVMPSLKRVITEVRPPRILHICGNTDPIVELMHQCGAEGISVEQRSDITRIRKKLGEDAIILGNIDPYSALVKGTPNDVKQAVKRAIRDGVSGVMPGCDIWPAVPRENMLALVNATREYGVH